MLISDCSSDVCSSDLQQWAPLAALIVGVEHEALGVIALQQHHPARRHAVLADRRQSHGGGVVRLGSLGLGQPGGKDVQRVGRSIRSDFHAIRSEEHTSGLQSLMRISYDVFCLTKQTYHLSSHK